MKCSYRGTKYGMTGYGCKSAYNNNPYKDTKKEFRKVDYAMEKEFCISNPSNCPFHPMNNTGVNRMTQTQKNNSMRYAYDKFEHDKNRPLGIGEIITGIIVLFILFKVVSFIVNF